MTVDPDTYSALMAKLENEIPTPANEAVICFWCKSSPARENACDDCRAEIFMAIAKARALELAKTWPK